MEDTNAHFKELLEKYINGKYTSEELNQLLKYLEESDNTVFNEQAKKIWQKLEKEQPDTSTHEEDLLHSGAMQIIQRFGKRKRTIMSKAKVLWGVAASIAILFISVSLFLHNRIYYNNSEEVSVGYLSTTIGKGERKEIQLADGSNIYINSKSQLTYPEHFEGGTREVILHGEAFFDIAPDKKRPFVINTSDVKIKVLGTSFNVRNYETSNKLIVTVNTGKVMVMIGENMMHLSPDEQLLINKSTGEFEKSVVEASKYNQWSKGVLYFDHTPLTDVIETLNDWYNVDIQLTKEYHILISGEHDNKSLEAVLESICFTGNLKLIKEGDTYTLYK